MKQLLFLLPLLSLACSQAPIKEYQWTSLSEKGLIQNSLRVKKESRPQFVNTGGYENIESKKQQRVEAGLQSVQKIVLIGDTGCRLKESGEKGSYQNCKDPQAWPYAAVVNQIAAEKPDLIIHLGDYHYREHCSQDRACRNMTDTVGYGWKSWQQDFFEPSEIGLKVAPWIFVRGNHEDCRRGYAGYKLLTEQQWPHDCLAREKTEYISIGDILIVQLDSSSSSEGPATAEEQTHWEQEFKEIDKVAQASSAKHIWLFTHKPLVGVVEFGDGKYSFGNANLRKAFAKTNLAKKIELMVGGHVHNTQYVVAKNYPLQLVVGNGSSAMDYNALFTTPDKLLKTKFEDNSIQLQKFSSDTTSERSFGYATLTRDPQQNQRWIVSFHDLNGKQTLQKLIQAP